MLNDINPSINELEKSFENINVKTPNKKYMNSRGRKFKTNNDTTTELNLDKIAPTN
jgi:hypothetical protein